MVIGQYRQKFVLNTACPQFETEIETAFLQNMETFHQLKNSLLIEHKGEYVAILGGQPVDFDVDDEKLAQRMYEKYGDVPFFIAFVSTEPIVFDLPVPEIGGN